MSGKQTLLKPLRSDSLKPRPSPQAVWEPGPVTEQAAEPSAAPVHLHALSGIPRPVESHKPDEPAPDVPDLGVLIASIVTEEDDEEDPSAEPDALPTEQMPEPVCVPLYEEFSPVQRPRLWPWLVLTALLLAGCAYTAWTFGWLHLNWA